MLPFNAFLVDYAPVDVVPSALQTFLVPLCEGIVVGLVLGAGVLFVMSKVERLVARRTEAQTIDAQTIDAQLTETKPNDAQRPGMVPPSVKSRLRRPAPQRPTLLARLT